MIIRVITALTLLFSFQASAVVIGFSPEAGSNIISLFESPELWAGVRNRIQYFSVYPGHLTDGQCGNLCRDNTLQRFIQVGAFEKLKQWNIRLGLQTGSVKPGIHCDAKKYTQEHSDLIENVKNLGGEISYITMDWPRDSGKNNCHQSVSTTAKYVADYALKLQAAHERTYPGHPFDIGLFEGYPTFEATELIQWLGALEKYGFKPTHFIIDIDRPRHEQLGRDDRYLKNVLSSVQNYCRSRGIRFGVALWGNTVENPHAYHDNVFHWANKVKALIGTPEHIEILSWEYWVQKQNIGNVIPYNLPESDQYSHTGLLLEVTRNLVGSVPYR